MKILSSGRTDPGKKRANNEDAYLVDDRLGLFAVADGIGGHEGGEIASRLIVETLRELAPDILSGHDSTPPYSVSRDVEPRAAALRYALTLANAKIFQTTVSRPSLTGMGSTATVLHLWRGRAFVAHIGDSRAYLLRAGKMCQITDDHSLVAEQVRAGTLTPRQAQTSSYRHVITRAVGIDREIVVDQATLAVEEGDVLLLCTDGLTEMVTDDKIASTLSAFLPDGATEALIRLANGQGGVDNITVVVVKIEETP